MSKSTSRTIVLVPSAARTATTSFNTFVLPEGFSGARIRLNVSAASGTTPTLDVFIQQGIRTAAATDTEQSDASGAVSWDDFIAFTRLTAVGTRYARVIGGGNTEDIAEAAAQTAGTVKSGPLGSRWRVHAVIGGTTPSFTFTVVAELLP